MICACRLFQKEFIRTIYIFPFKFFLEVIKVIINDIKFYLFKLPTEYISELHLRQYQGSLQPDQY